MTDPAVSLPPEIDPFRPVMLADPYAHYQRIREETPVYWSHFFGGWVLMCYTDAPDLKLVDTAPAWRETFGPRALTMLPATFTP